MNPQDSTDRDRIRTEVGTNLFVEAGAGTGKTHELVERVVELVAGGHLDDIRRLAAITFTEKAATELRDRIRRGLEDVTTDDDRQRRCRAALEHLDDAAIGTLHGFALRILSEFPIEAGLPPGFEVRDPVAAAVDFNERWARFVDELFASPELEPLLRRGFALNLRLFTLREVALELHQHWDRLLGPRHDEASLTLPAVDPTDVVEAMQASVDYAATCELNDKLAHKVLNELPPYIEQLREAAAAGDEPTLLTLLAEDAPSFKWGNIGARSDHIQGLRACNQQALTALQDTLSFLRRAVLLPLLDRLRRFTLDGARERQRAGRLEFADLLVHAAQLLEREDAVRAELGERWSVVLVDEFQDTDPLQIRIATLLTLSDPSDAPAAWEASRCAAGRLFVVGDPKQSIYRFRRADIALYDRAKDLFAEGAVQLTTNYRTVAPILDWINDVFAQVFGQGVREKQPGYHPLAATRDAIDDHAPVVLLGGPSEGRLSEIRETEAAHVASFIARLIGARRPVSSRRGGTRAARYDDVAILLPTRTSLPEIERGLEQAGIPYRIESRSLVFGTDEVRDLLTILQAIDHPGDAVALVGALRTAAFGCSDRDLAEFRWAGGAWSVRFSPPDGLDPANPVPEAMAAISRYHELRHWLPVNELIDRIIRERGMVELTLARRRPRDHWRRYRLLLDEARAFVAGGGVSLGEFVAWAEQQAEEGASRVESIIPEPDDEAVRILTIHAAKGLEFPITVVAGLNAQAKVRNSRVLWPASSSPSSSLPEVSIGNQADPFETAGYRATANEEQGMDALEKQRLLYVAATRARDQLVVSVHHKVKSECHAALLWTCTQASPDLFVHEDVEGEPGGTTVPAPAAYAVEPSTRIAAAIADWTAERAALLAAAPGRGAVAPSSIELPPDEDEARLPGRRGRAGTAIGRAVHAVLQVVDLADPTDVDRLARVNAAAEGVAVEADTVAALARSAIESPAVQASMDGRAWREVAITAPVGGALVEGYIDLLYETSAGEVVVVDYKTDQARTEAELDAAVEHYRAQGAAYALAVEQALGRPVARCVFVFARAGGAVERTIDDLDGAKAEVVTQLATGSAP